MEDIKNMTKKKVKENLKQINNGNTNFNYEIQIGYDEYMDYVKIGRTPKEQLKILMMCYMANPKLEELKTWDLKQIIDYIVETDECFEEYKVYLDEICKFIDNKDCNEIIGGK